MKCHADPRAYPHFRDQIGTPVNPYFVLGLTAGQFRMGRAATHEEQVAGPLQASVDHGAPFALELPTHTS